MTHLEFQVSPFPHPGVVVVTAESRRSFGRHTHDQYGVGIIIHGAQRSASGRGQVETGAGAVITVNPGEVHDGTPIGDAARRWVMLYLEPDAVRQAWNEDAEGDYEFEAPAFQDPAAKADLAALFDKRTQSSSDLLVEERLLLLLNRLSARRATRTSPHGFAPEVLRAKALIDDDPAAPLRLRDLAQASGLSRFQTLRAFARATGLTPHAYLIQRRLQSARRLIAAGRTLVEAALESGFHDQSHMTCLFVRVHGYSPGAYARAAA